MNFIRLKFNHSCLLTLRNVQLACWMITLVHIHSIRIAMYTQVGRQTKALEHTATHTHTRMHTNQIRNILLNFCQSAHFTKVKLSIIIFIFPIFNLFRSQPASSSFQHQPTNSITIIKRIYFLLNSPFTFTSSGKKLTFSALYEGNKQEKKTLKRNQYPESGLSPEQSTKCQTHTRNTMEAISGRWNREYFRTSICARVCYYRCIPSPLLMGNMPN